MGNWRSHDDQKDTQAAFVPDANLVNFYTTWPAFVDSNADGVPDKRLTLSLEQDGARGFLYKRQENETQYLYYKHDLFGRLIEVSRGDTTVPQTVLARYGYFADGRLAWRQEGASGARERLVYDGAQPLLQGVDNPTADSWTFVWAGSSLVKSTRRQTVSGSLTMVVTYPHQDRQGSIVLQTRSVNSTVQTYGHAVYDPYGRPSTTPLWGTNSVDVPFGYTGARREDAVGLYLMGARWYDPVLGRFLEEDPIGEAGGLNTYAYVGSSPVSWVDPSGLSRRSTAGSSQMVWGGGHRSPAGMDSWSRVSASDAGGLPRSGGFEPNRDDRHEAPDAPYRFRGREQAPNPFAEAELRWRLARAQSAAERREIRRQYENDPKRCPMCQEASGDKDTADKEEDEGAGEDTGGDVPSSGDANAGAQNDNPSEQTPATPEFEPAPEEIICTDQYYEWRYEHMPEGYKADKGPEYFRDFGARKYNDFEELRQRTDSPQLADFIVRAGCELQKLTEKALLGMKPEDRNSRATVAEAAVRIHARAYENAGFQNLFLEDKVQVLRTAMKTPTDLLLPGSTQELRSGIRLLLGGNVLPRSNGFYGPWMFPH